MKTVILDGFAVNPGDLSWSFLEEFGAYEVYDQTPPDQVIARLRGATMAVTNRVRVDRTVIDACPTLRFLSAFGTGYDMIDVAACREAGIEVCNIPGYSTVSVAQLAFTLLLALTTDIPGYRRAVREGRWTGQPDFYYPAIPFTELAGKTVGVYGCGAIGKRFASLCRAFDMRVLAYRRSAVLGERDGVTYVTAEQLLSESDVISLHCPLTEETRGLVNARFLSAMKKGAYLINTSRGAVIDETALYEALTSGQLGGAALDVM
ncbi:MAG: D-2-hydroxyacid dehydrogenase, partial [Ruminococcaceae bacterium]|nr:D-2-hydroxyacid dehydrogenase [Oscillospiraceae bacterium]